MPFISTWQHHRTGNLLVSIELGKHRVLLLFSILSIWRANHWATSMENEACFVHISFKAKTNTGKIFTDVSSLVVWCHLFEKPNDHTQTMDKMPDHDRLVAVVGVWACRYVSRGASGG